jgi:hypothetical protein
MIKNTDFPLRIAAGEAFCNRVDERTKLKKLLLSGQHLWLQAHRRHGKSSLLLQTFKDLQHDNKNVIYIRVDLAFASDRVSVLNKLCQGASTLIIEALRMARQTKPTELFAIVAQQLGESFNRYAPSFSIDKGSISMKLGTEASLDMLETSLQKLNEISKAHNIRVVFMIDEFQQLSKSDNQSFDIEGAIRHNLELADNITYVFCGSEHNLMCQALEENIRPLYKHTYRFELKRISRDSYLKHIQPLWLAQWQTDIDNSVFDYIMEITQRHPYYVNYLCAEMWLCESTPTIESAELAWGKIVEDELSVNKKMILDLKSNEKKTLRALAILPTREVAANRFVTLANIPAGSMKKTINQLLNKDLIYLDEGVYKILSPALASIAANG